MTAIYHFLCNERRFRSPAALRKAHSPSPIISAGWSSKRRHDAAMIGPYAVLIMLNEVLKGSAPTFLHRGTQRRKEGHNQGQIKSRIGKGVERNDDSTRLPPPDIPSCGTRRVAFSAS